MQPRSSTGEPGAHLPVPPLPPGLDHHEGGSGSYRCDKCVKVCHGPRHRLHAPGAGAESGGHAPCHKRLAPRRLTNNPLRSKDWLPACTDLCFHIKHRPWQRDHLPSNPVSLSPHRPYLCSVTKTPYRVSDPIYEVRSTGRFH